VDELLNKYPSRRPTCMWSHLEMEGLKQKSPSKRDLLLWTIRAFFLVNLTVAIEGESIYIQRLVLQAQRQTTFCIDDSVEQSSTEVDVSVIEGQLLEQVEREGPLSDSVLLPAVPDNTKRLSRAA